MTKGNGNRDNARTANIVLAIAGLTALNTAFLFLLGICVNVGLTFSKYHDIAIRQNVMQLSYTPTQKEIEKLVVKRYLTASNQNFDIADNESPVQKCIAITSHL